jgi:prepilin-type N-terminal cleavage/methylation domain-containing protein
MSRLQGPRRAGGRRPPRGVTLVELVVVLTIVGLVASLGATLVGRVVAGRQAQHGRLTLAMAADGALARVADELQQALPNSLRVSDSGGGFWVEWVPVLDGGRYRLAPDTVAADPGDPLDLEDAADDGFDVIGQPLAALAAGSQLVLHNLGVPEADAYAGSNRRAGLLVGTSGGRHLRLHSPPARCRPATGTPRFFRSSARRSRLGCVARRWPAGFELRRYTGYGWLHDATRRARAAERRQSTLMLVGPGGLQRGLQHGAGQHRAAEPAPAPGGRGQFGPPGLPAADRRGQHPMRRPAPPSGASPCRR